MIKVKNNIAVREPIPQFLIGLSQESLSDLSWTDPSLGVQDCKWLPEIDRSPALGPYERYGAETLAVGGGVVIVTRAVVPWSAEEISADLTSKRSNIWSRIKQIRDTKTQQGGYKAQGKWFHSDTFSRSQQIGLARKADRVEYSNGDMDTQFSGDEPNSLLFWKTMDGSFVPVTPRLAQSISDAAEQSDISIFKYAEQLNQQVKLSANPTSIDIEQDWPETYQGV